MRRGATVSQGQLERWPATTPSLRQASNAFLEETIATDQRASCKCIYTGHSYFNFSICQLVGNLRGGWQPLPQTAASNTFLEETIATLMLESFLKVYLYRSFLFQFVNFSIGGQLERWPATTPSDGQATLFNRRQLQHQTRELLASVFIQVILREAIM